METLKEFFSSSVWTKLFLDIILILFLQQLKKKTELGAYSFFRFLFIGLLVRDILFHFFYVPEINIASDLMILYAYYHWMRQFTGRKKGDIVFQIAIIVSGFVILLNIPLGFIPGQLTGLLRINNIVYSVILAIGLYRVSEFNTVNSWRILATKRTLVLSMLSYSFLMIFFDKNFFGYAILVPAFNLINLYVLNEFSDSIDTRNQHRIQDLSVDITNLFEFMRTIGNAITERIDLDHILEYIVKSAVKNTRADAGAILMIDEYEDILKIRSIEGIFPPPYRITDKVKQKTSTMLEYFESSNIGIKETIFGDVVQTGKPLFIRNSSDDKRLEQNTNNDLQFISSIIIVPLIVNQRILGLLSVLKRKRGEFFSEDEFENINSFADYTSLTLDNVLTYMELLEKKEMEREVGIAAEIQQKLLPSKLPKMKNIDISAYSIPAKGVSGDYYDILKLRKGKIAFVMCDVAGKGVPASLVMIMIRSIIHLIAGASKDASTIVSWINKGITGRIDIDHFATLCFITYDPNTRVLEYSNAGHHPIMVYRNKTQSIESFDTDGLPIGIEANAKYETGSTTLGNGDFIILYTDGIIEAMDSKGNQYSYESLEKYVKENPEKTPQELSKGISNDIQDFVGKARQHDDQSLLVIKVS